ncbi:hypothetical protein [Serratia proteamaculans]|uniref:hypothetical protein n=1 Tax=Serratia proteamaculans TaxID=28151 RepID=UPI00101F64FC|nr:hypothetical protein [Serratia proteamaculans]RYM55610.1 hypothetical protein BSQ96_02575 [Serratia proteamaculans]
MANSAKILVGAVILGSMPFSAPLMGKLDIQNGWDFNPISPKQKAPNHRRMGRPMRKSKGKQHG